MTFGAITAEQRHEMAELVRKRLGNEKALQWWTTPNPMLGEISPMEMTLLNREEKLYQFIKAMMEEDPAGCASESP